MQVDLRTINPTARTRYVLKCEQDLPADKQTVWILRPLTTGDVYDAHASVSRGSERCFEHELLRRAVVDVENLSGGNGPVAYTREVLGALSFANFSELAAVAVGSYSVGITEAGKS